MKFFTRYIGWGRLAGLALLVTLIALRIADPVFVERLRLQAFDSYQQIKPRDRAPVPVAIIDVDDRSLAEIGQWPWPRTQIAQMTASAMQAGAVALAFDIIFSEPDRLSPDNIVADNPGLPAETRAALAQLPANDQVLADVFSRARVVLGQTSLRNAGQGGAAGSPPREVPHAILGADPAPFLIRFPDLIQNLDVLEDAASGYGMFTVFPDPDGVYRRVPVVMQADGAYRLGLSIELLRVATGGDAFAIRANQAGIDGVVVARQLIRTEQDGTVWNNFSASSRDRFVSAVDLMRGDLPPGRLAGHLVLVGTSAIGLEDFRATPLGVPMAGVEIHAQVLENILGQTLLYRPNYAIGLELVSVTVLSLLIIALAPLMAARYLLIGTFTLIGLAIGYSFYLFSEHRQLVDPTFPVFGVFFCSVLMTSVNYIREELRKQQIRGAFGQYVSPDLVATLADNPDKLKLGGERRELSILFTDVRGFTTISESFRDDPPGLTALMNRFLTVMSDAIMAQGGTIDKYMGDAIMAFWNAPLDSPDHARRSCAAALAMLRDIDALNAARDAETGGSAVPIDIGIGINTGDAVVGNMGSDKRFDYSALGDPVNLASRLEGQTKSYGVDVVIGATTRAAVEGDFAVIELDLIRVKGKQLPEHIYALLGDGAMRGAPAFDALASANAEMIDAYRRQDWESAGAGADAVAARARDLGLDLDGYAQMYRDRIAAFRGAPPPPDWDGVFVATSK
ncbi:MAG: adenylate/guanylate cyclase domain-containing protein [Rhodobacteraceae bacterium]|nr:adenylate/guanylate cyclase domain-containing protein [Paracoccaceae bacterium]